MSYYAKFFQEKAPSYDPRHIEAFIRLEYGTLNHLDNATFDREIAIAIACIEQGGVEEAEQLAVSFGL